MELSVSVVIYKPSLNEVNQLLSCLARETRVNLVDVIDNSPDSGAVSLLLQHPKIQYRHNPSNPGYGASHNISLRDNLQISKYHLVINPDVYWNNEIFGMIIRYMDHHSEVGLLMPRVLNPDGSLQQLSKLLPTPLDLASRRFLPTALTPANDDFSLVKTGYNKIMNVPWLSGCFMFLRMSAVAEVGLFDERFFMYGEDIDFSRRMHMRFKTIFYPDISIYHGHAQESYKSLRMTWIHAINIIKYFNKWGWIFDPTRRSINRKCLHQLVGHG